MSWVRSDLGLKCPYITENNPWKIQLSARSLLGSENIITVIYGDWTIRRPLNSQSVKSRTGQLVEMSWKIAKPRIYSI